MSTCQKRGYCAQTFTRAPTSNPLGILTPLRCCVKIVNLKKILRVKDCMTPKTMRQLWAVIESTQVNTLLQLDDLTLVQWLLKQFTDQQVIDEQEVGSLNTYINSRLPLIRDTAFERQSVGQEGH